MTVVVVSSGCAVADEDDNANTRGGLTAQVCGMEVAPSPQTIETSACEMGRTIFGPARFERDRGRPTAESASFEVSADSTVCISLRNGDDAGNHRISAGWIELDGAEFAVPDDFDQQFAGTEGEFELSAGTHTFDVELASMPTAYVDLEVREPFAALDTPTDVVSDDGTLELTNLATDHPLLTPNGDGHHDTTVFNADVEPLITLPGKDAGTTDYFFEWEFVVTNLDTCQSVDTGITGTTQVNSPTNIQATWDGTDGLGNPVPDGNYAYSFEVTLVDEDGVVFGTLTESVAPNFGVIVDGTSVDFDEQPEYPGMCDLNADPFGCACPGGGGPGGSTDPNCSVGDDHPIHATTYSFEDPSSVPLGDFITTTQDPATGRYSVVVDLRDFNRAGLVPKRIGEPSVPTDRNSTPLEWEDEAELRQWVSDMTGVPVGSGPSLFNFDYTQLGTSTGFSTEDGISPAQFNHFFLDAITDANGDITIDGVTTDVDAMLNGTSSPPTDFEVLSPRVNDECTKSGNTNGDSSVTSKLCAYNEAIPLGGTNVGIYMLRSALFDVTIDGETVTRDDVCIVNAFFSCTVRTFDVPVDSLEVESSYYVEDGGVAAFAFADTVNVADANGVSIAANREGAGGIADGVCTRGVAMHDGIRVRMDAADGSVPGTCIVNGVFP